MKEENCVLFKGTKDGIVLQLSKEAEYEDIKANLEEKIEGAARFFNGVKTSILFKGKKLTEEQETELLQIISEKTSMDILFVKREEFGEAFAEKLPICMQTKYYKGNVRSGQVLEFHGSVVIVGDINPGAEVRADGNIIVLGALKGIAHAGAGGMTDAFISALNLVPAQLRIADIITRFPEANEKQEDKKAEYAYVDGSQIYVVPLE